MNILVFNCGSSSLTFKMYTRDPGHRLREIFRGKAGRVGVTGDRPSTLTFVQDGVKTGGETRIDGHKQAAGLIFDEIERRGLRVDAVGHRWAHSRGRFTT
ncbi:MAG TPA: hypothetical protein VHE79_06270, partial [Spirochaetia bacterium]